MRECPPGVRFGRTPQERLPSKVCWTGQADRVANQPGEQVGILTGNPSRLYEPGHGTGRRQGVQRRAAGLQLLGADTGLVTVNVQIGFRAAVQCAQCCWQRIIQLLFSGGFAPWVKAGLAHKLSRDELYQPLL